MGKRKKKRKKRNPPSARRRRRHLICNSLRNHFSFPIGIQCRFHPKSIVCLRRNGDHESQATEQMKNTPRTSRKIHRKRVVYSWRSVGAFRQVTKRMQEREKKTIESSEREREREEEGEERRRRADIYKVYSLEPGRIQPPSQPDKTSFSLTKSEED